MAGVPLACPAAGGTALSGADGGAGPSALGNVLNREIVRVELAGSRNAPAVVITRGESAVVLFRGGSSTQQAVETLLTRRARGKWKCW